MFVKSPVFPFVRFPGVDTILGPEMKSTGEVMGGVDQIRRGVREGAAVGRAAAAGEGTAFISVNNDDKPNLVPIARDLAELGFQPDRDPRHGRVPPRHGLDVDVVFKVNEGRPNIADEIVNRKIELVVNTPLGRESFFDDRAMRRAAMLHEVPCITTLTGAAAAVGAIRALRQQGARRPRAAGLLRGRDPRARVAGRPRIAADGHARSVPRTFTRLRGVGANRLTERAVATCAMQNLPHARA